MNKTPWITKDLTVTLNKISITCFKIVVLGFISKKGFFNTCNDPIQCMK
jgi:hypothetical protein